MDNKMFFKDQGHYKFWQQIQGQILAVAYAENFNGRGFYSVAYGGHKIFGMWCLWRHNLTSYSCFQINVLAKFVDTVCVFFCTHSLNLYVTALTTNYQRSRLRYRRKFNSTAMTQQFRIAKISGCALKQGSKTHSPLRQSNFQLQNQATLMSCRIRAVEHWKCAAWLSNTHPGLQDRILLNYTRIENVHKVCKKTFDFLLYIEVQQILFFLFLCWDIIKCLNASVLTTAVFELGQQFYHATETGNVANTVSTCAAQP